jgi:hypothetical protein
MPRAPEVPPQPLCSRRAPRASQRSRPAQLPRRKPRAGESANSYPLDADGGIAVHMKRRLWSLVSEIWQCPRPKSLRRRPLKWLPAKSSAVQQQLADPMPQLVVDAQSRAIALRKLLDVADRVENRGKLATLSLSFQLEQEAMIPRIEIITVVTPHIQCIRISDEFRMRGSGALRHWNRISNWHGDRYDDRFFR